MLLCFSVIAVKCVHKTSTTATEKSQPIRISPTQHTSEFCTKTCFPSISTTPIFTTSSSPTPADSWGKFPVSKFLSDISLISTEHSRSP
ncbi:hypothetical protein CEXT_344031 [Caerostris extrusa]|uniref:Uncharacterized protein n=1 Tax=Caerostris extrusa TaxID=172846 RepID=A0AAV4U8F0_CAEEX|nr:hypothetical protein CEXT_344031 [Caerostris extrusa]